MEINDELMRQWEPKVQRFASTTYIAGIDRDDLIQELRIAIVKAALISIAQRQLVSESLDDTFDDIETDDGPQQSLKILKALTDPQEFTEDVELQALLVQAKLSTVETQFVNLRLEGLTMEEITEDLGESSYKIRQGVRDKLQEVLHYEQEKTFHRGIY